MSPAALALVVVTTVAEPGPAAGETVESAAVTDDSLTIAASQLDRQAVANSLSLRVGQAWRNYAIEVSDGETGDTVAVRIVDAQGRTHTRVLPLAATGTAGRSRELASALALLIEQRDNDGEPEPSEPTPSPSETPSVPEEKLGVGWLGLGPRVAFNPATKLAPELGMSVAGGAWLVRAHLQPVAELSWGHAIEAEPKLDVIRGGAGLLGGAAIVERRLWVGGGALIRAQWALVRGARRVHGWWASPAIVAAAQYRGRVLLAGLWLGADLSLPPLVAKDGPARVRWGVLRPMATVHVGVRLPLRRAILE